MEQWYYLLRSPFASLDPATQQWVYRSFYQFVYKDIYFKTHDRSLTEDIIQEAFLKASMQGPHLQSDINIPGWVKQVARTTALDWLRKKNKNRQITKLAHAYMEAKASHEVSVASAVETKVRDELLHQALAELKDDYRTILILFYIQNKSYRQICHELQLTEPVLTQRLARARKKLLRHFLQKWALPDE